jgi:potassium-transporting ATPase KdpC subunit
MMLQSLRAIVSLLVISTVLLGFVYPLAVTVLAQLAFPSASGGSLLETQGGVAGSELLGQQFTKDRYFWSRPSATQPPYNATASSGSNLSPANPKLLERVNERVAALKKADPKNTLPIPVDLVTASASGLDPHISVAAAEYQVARVARARGHKEQDIRALVATFVEEPGFGVIGEARVNVLRLNMALDKAEHRPVEKR